VVPRGSELAWINKIELRGFKSFGNTKVVLPFSRGLTAIVGRNGSGKSNITDAISFAFGERSAKSMRGERYTHLIYKRYKKLLAPYAEVTLHIDNSDGAIQIPSKTVTITRRVDHSGKCTYRINGKRVDRQEIVELLSPVMGSPDDVNFVRQGQIKRIFSMNPTELRQVIDNLAGVSEYDEKREKTENEIRQVTSNLQTLEARLSEIRGTVNRLRTEAQDYVKHKELSGELQKVRGAILHKRRKDLERKLEKVVSKLESKKGAGRHLRQKAERCNELADDFQLKAEKLQNLVEKKKTSGELSKIYKWEQEIKFLSGLLKQEASRRRGLEEELEKVKSGMSASKTKFSRGLDKLKKLQENLRSLAQKLEKVKDIDEARELAREIATQIQGIDDALTTISLEISKSRVDAKDIESVQKLLKLNAQIEIQLEREKDLKTKIENYQKKLGRADSRKKKLEEDIEKIQKRAQRFSQKAKDLRQKAQEYFGQAISKSDTGALESKRASLGGELTTVKRELEKISVDYTPLLKLGIFELNQRERRLSEELQKIGEVNPKAIQSLKEQEARLKEEENKFNKLEGEKQALLAEIQKLDREKREVFMRVFNAVSQNFSQIFYEISGGCSGRLVLENEENPFEGGLQIEADFDGGAGAALQLSGGQQTLTSVALLLALQRYRPSTFYVLDEMDESLDPFNRKQVARLLKRYSKDSQIVVVTLHNSLAAVADRVFGVVKENGVSKVFSVELSGLGD